MSHKMKSYVGNVLHTRLSQPQALRVARHCHGYSAWQMSHQVKPNALAAL